MDGEERIDALKIGARGEEHGPAPPFRHGAAGREERDEGPGDRGEESPKRHAGMYRARAKRGMIAAWPAVS